MNLVFEILLFLSWVFRLDDPNGERLDYRVAMAVEGNGTNFTVSTETVQK